MLKTIIEKECLPQIYGGYISIKKDGKEFHISSVPSFVLGTDRYHDSVYENGEEFEDDEGNKYEIKICSSNVGVDWELILSAKNGNDESLEKRIITEYQSNDY